MAFNKEQIEILEKLLKSYGIYENNNISLNLDSITQYEYSTAESSKLIDLYNFRLAGQSKKSPTITDLIEKLAESKQQIVLVHSLKIEGGQDLIIYTDTDCEKIIYILRLL